MRVRRQFGAFSALVVALALGFSAFTPPAGAQAAPTPTTVAANTPGTLPDGDDIPSCSLFPTRLGLGRWVFTNTKDFAITLSIITRSTDGISAPIGTEVTVFDGTLDGGESTPEFILTPDTTIHWAGGTYHLSAYDFVNCLELEPPGDDIVLPTTTVPAPVQQSIPVESTTSTTAPADTSTSEAPTSTLADVPVTTAAVAVEAVDLAYRSVATTTPAPLPTTGFPVGFAALVGVTLILFGLAGLAIARHRDAERWGDELGS